MKVLLINPPTGIYDRSDRCQAPIKDEGIEMIRPPMDLAYMAAMVEKADGEAIIKDYPAEKKGQESFLKDLIKIRPDLLILSVTTPTLDADLKYCQLAKKINRKIITLAKGAHFYELDVVVLKKYKNLDIVIKGEPEESVYKIVKKKNLRKIAGITYREKGKIHRNPERAFLENLDELPLPARHLLNNNLYVYPDTREPYALILSGRGCPGRCIFCLVGKVSGRKLRTRSVDSILKEITECVDRLGIKSFFFRADTFTWDRKWVIEFCQTIIGRGLKIRWGTNSRVDTIDESLILLMKKAGCDVIGFGIESGSKEILRKMKKDITLKKAIDAVKLCDKHKLKTLLFFVLGLPWETKETIEETIEFAKKIPGTFYNFSIAYPFPGTEYAKIAQENSLVTKDSIYGFNYANPVVRTFSLTSEELLAYRKKALRSIYFRPSYIVRVLRTAMTPKQAINYLRQGFTKATELININL